MEEALDLLADMTVDTPEHKVWSLPLKNNYALSYCEITLPLPTGLSSTTRECALTYNGKVITDSYLKDLSTVLITYEGLLIEPPSNYKNLFKLLMKGGD